MNTSEHTVDLRYTRDELYALFAVANAEDVEQGGRYEARAGVNQPLKRRNAPAHTNTGAFPRRIYHAPQQLEATIL
jgi:hypothetical protein